MALLTVALIIAGAWRLYAIVGATPMLGYANQFDMARISACVGLWPDLPAPARFEAHPQAPLSRYVRRDDASDECYFSSELALVAPAVMATPVGKPVDLRRAGIFKATMLFVVALIFTVLLRDRPGWALLHAALFAIVICDPLNTLWLNTLYTEFAALFFLYTSVVLLVLIGAREIPADPPERWLVMVFALSLVGLGLSRQQHLLLPVVLALPVLVSLWGSGWRSAIALLAVTALIAVAQSGIIERNPKIAAANSANVVLGAILPASLEPALTAQRLGLPERCLQSLGATWYVTMGESLQKTCPEARGVSRARQAWLLFTEPLTLLRAGLRALPQLQDWRLGYMGAVEGQVYAGAEAVREIGGAGAFSVAPVVTAMPPAAFLFVLTASLVLLVCSAIVALTALVLERRAPLALTLYALTATAWYAIATAIGGDGYVEVARHAQLATTSLYAAGVLLAMTLVAPLAAPLWVLVGGSARALGRAGLAALGYTVLALGIAAPLQLLLRAAMATTPMSIGVVDLPARNVVPADVVELSGWALDPQGVAAVEVVTGNGEVIAATLDLPYAGARGEPLELYYPAYPMPARAGFVAHLPRRLFDSGAVDLRTHVVNASGMRTEIDRRRLVAEKR
ncbi:MAG: hypothetical protein ABI537_05945 [Casimicrobiaceae bacterium]